MMRTALLLSILIPALAAAGPSYTVDPAAPFTAHDLAEAVQLRTEARSDVRVTRVDDGLLVEVDDTRQVVDVRSDDPHDAARVVALVVVSLVDAPPAPALAPPGSTETPAALTASVAPPPAPSRWSLRAAIGMSRDDGGTISTPLTGAVSYQLATSARLVGSVTYMKATSPTRGSMFVPMRFGVEGRAGALGVELGGILAPHATCNDGSMLGTGGYATGRVYLPVSERANVIVEAGGYYMVEQAYGCDVDPMQSDPDGFGERTYTLRGEAYGGHFGGGVEWRL